MLARSEIKVSWKNPEGTVDSYRIDTSTDTYVWMSKVESTTNVMVDANDGTVTYTDTNELEGETLPVTTASLPSTRRGPGWRRLMTTPKRMALIRLPPAQPRT